MLQGSKQWSKRKGPAVKIFDHCVIMGIWNGIVENCLAVTLNLREGFSLSGPMPVVLFAVIVTALKLH